MLIRWMENSDDDDMKPVGVIWFNHWKIENFFHHHRPIKIRYCTNKIDKIQELTNQHEKIFSHWLGIGIENIGKNLW